MPKAIPGFENSPIHKKKWFLELMASVPPAVAGSVAASNLLTTTVAWVGIVAFAGVIWLVAASGLKIRAAYDQDKKEEPNEKHEGLRASLHVVYAVAASACSLEADKAAKVLRATFHRVCDDEKELEQIVDYIGGAGGGKNRRFSIRSGIVGKSARMNAVYAASRNGDSKEQYENDLINEWGYNRAEIASLSMDTFSWMAIPVNDQSGKRVLGVIYIDSRDKNVFNGDDVKRAIVVACAGVTNYVGEKYGNV